MSRVAPLVDSRSAADVAAQVRDLLAVYAPGWHAQVVDPLTGEARSDPLANALIAIFGRFAEIILQRLNRVPDKNQLAFLDLLGEARLPPEPANVALSFSLAPGSLVDALVPAGTQVAAPPAEGEKDPVIFETERELVVTTAQLAYLFAREPAEDLYADREPFLIASRSEPEGGEFELFAGDRAIEHSFYLGHDTLFGGADLRQLRLTFTLAETPPDPDPRELQWEIWDGQRGMAITPDDGTGSLQHDGEWVLAVSPGMFPIPPSALAGSTSRWLRCRLQTPITTASERRDGRLRASQLPEIIRVTAQADRGASDQEIEVAFFNQLVVDLGKDFYPFGEKPRFGDCLHLACGLAFAANGGTITLHVDLTNPTDGKNLPVPATQASADIDLRWEFWDGRQWAAVAELSDDSENFTRSGDVTFRLAGQPVPTTIGGVEKYWIRIRLAAGNYGREARYEPLAAARTNADGQVVEAAAPATAAGSAGYQLVPADFCPPVIRRLQVDYTVTGGEEPLTAFVTDNDFARVAVVDSAFFPFRAPADDRPTVYFGFLLPAGRNRFPNRKLSVHAAVAALKSAAGQGGAVASSATAPLRLAWEYSSAAGWSSLQIADDSENFTRSGVLDWLAPADIAARSEFGETAYWLRVRWESGDYVLPPRLRRLLFNTTPALQAVTVRNEILGASDGSENQRLSSVRSPLLAGERLEVREPELPPVAEQASIRQASGDDAITVVDSGNGGKAAIWVRWLRVPDFYGSGPRDRHYVLDPLTGEFRFGNGRQGLIPPVGVGNIRLASYRTGGGVRGNRPANTIVQLKTTVPYVDKVTNPDPASGGAEAEGLSALLERAPRALRHRHRAVSIEDYQDLALLASPEVARALCVPLHNLAIDPDASTSHPGVVSLIVVPGSSDAKPLPTLTLLDEVRSYLDERRIATADLVVVAPEYVRVDVKVEVALVSLEGAGGVANAVAQALAGFLHPLTGGLDQNGWDFGRQPHRSDLYALLEAVPGVDHLNDLQVSEIEERPGAIAGGRFLVYSGEHDIRLTFGEA